MPRSLSQHASFRSIPVEIFLHILRYIPSHADLANLAAVCKSFHNNTIETLYQCPLKSEAPSRSHIRLDNCLTDTNAALIRDMSIVLSTISPDYDAFSLLDRCTRLETLTIIARNHEVGCALFPDSTTPRRPLRVLAIDLSQEFLEDYRERAMLELLSSMVAVISRYYIQEIHVVNSYPGQHAVLLAPAMLNSEISFTSFTFNNFPLNWFLVTAVFPELRKINFQLQQPFTKLEYREDYSGPDDDLNRKFNLGTFVQLMEIERDPRWDIEFLSGRNIRREVILEGGAILPSSDTDDLARWIVFDLERHAVGPDLEVAGRFALRDFRIERRPFRAGFAALETEPDLLA